MTAHRTRLYHRLQIAAHRVQKAADRATTEAAGVTTAQAAVLAVIDASGGATTQRAVAGQLGLNESALTQMTGRLLRLGLVARIRDPGDARAWRLDLTADGKAALARLRGPFQRVNARLDAALKDADLAALADALDCVALAFGDT